MPLITKPQINFDVNNPDHVSAIRRSLREGKLDPTFRFLVEEGFSSAMSMALYKMADAWMSENSHATPVIKPMAQEEFVHDPSKVVLLRRPVFREISKRGSTVQ